MSNDQTDNTDIDQNMDATEEAQAQPEQALDLAAQLAEAQAKAEENWNAFLTAKADMENMRRRQTRDLENAHKHALDKFVNELLPICDSLELGINASKTDQATLDTVREGMDMTLKMLLGNIGKLGLEQLDPEGEAFDPECHQAVSMQPAEGVASNQVISVMQKGYSFNGRVIRPAMVVVSQ
jgi:molecular chaperone GrpE